MKWYENVSRYFLVLWDSLCVADGWGYILFGYHLFGEPSYLFLEHLMSAMWFWVFLKIIQAVGMVSLLFNYRPAIGLVLLMPVNAVLCLFYFFEFQACIPVAVLIIISTFILIRSYRASYLPLLREYPGLSAKVSEDSSRAEAI